MYLCFLTIPYFKTYNTDIQVKTKILLYPIGLLLLLGVELGCKTTASGKRHSPAEVSERFFAALGNQEYAKAKEMGTESTVRLIGVIEMLSNMGGGANILRDNKKQLMGCEILGDQAICTYEAFSGPDEKVVLVKVKGKWLVDLKGDPPQKAP